MGSEPEVVVQNPLSQTGSKFKLNLKPKPVLGLLLLVAVVSSLTYFTLSNMDRLKFLVSYKSPPVITKTQKPKFIVADFRRSMVKDIRTTFASNKDAGIMAYVDLAGQEKNEFQSYQYYVKAFNKMKETYMQTQKEPVSTASAGKRLDQKITMVGLVAYASTLKYYKESDFVIPK